MGILLNFVRTDFMCERGAPVTFFLSFFTLLAQGKVNSTAPGALTAYVLTALLEGGLADAQVVESALRCISAQRDPSAHNLALSAYAAALAGHESAKEYLEKLESIAVHKGEFVFKD